MKDIKQLVEDNNRRKTYKAFSTVYMIEKRSRVKYWLLGIIFFGIILLFIPWTQNIRARGSVTTLRQEQRPQELNTIISGRITKWFVKEGDWVRKGDTIVQLAEVKDDYLDTNLLNRTQQQIDAKSASIRSYNLKVSATEAQILAIAQTKELKKKQLANKMGQLQLKIVSDSMELVAASNDLKIADEQYKRQLVMRDSGLASLVQVEQRNQNFQNALAKKTSAEIKFNNTKTDLINTRIELSQVEQEYSEKIFKSQSEVATAQSEIAAGEGELAKLSNQYSNYAIRSGQYYLLAPQDGQITKARKAGLNEIVKESEKLAEIVPANIEYAIELFVRPVDLPLLSKGQSVRFLFDGFPAIVFSGWPEASYGTFAGKVVAIESSVSANGKFRILVGEDSSEKPWPRELKMGTGASGIALLKDVPIWYELWRNINGFPPDYYQKTETNNEKSKG